MWIKKTIRDENKREYLEGETAKVADKNIERLAEKLKMLCNKFEDSLEVVALHTEGAPHTDEYDRLESKLQKLPKFRTFDKKMDNTFEKRMN